MERQDIEVFLVLAEELHFAHTAGRLHVSAATISQTIAKLERRFGAPRFRRTTRRVERTSLDRQLQNDLRPAHAQVQAAIARATAAGHGIAGTLEVGYMSASVTQVLLPFIDGFRCRVPGRRAAIRETTLADLFDPLRRAEVNLSVLPLPAREPDLTVGPVLLPEPAMLAVPANHPPARRARVATTRSHVRGSSSPTTCPATGSTTTCRCPAVTPCPCAASRRSSPTSPQTTASPSSAPRRRTATRVRTVLHRNAAFRTMPAFAKGGREHYGLAPDTHARFEHCLAETAVRTCPSRHTLPGPTSMSSSSIRSRTATPAQPCWRWPLSWPRRRLARPGAPVAGHRWADDAEGAADLAVLLGILLTAAERRLSDGSQNDRTRRHT